MDISWQDPTSARVLFLLLVNTRGHPPPPADAEHQSADESHFPEMCSSTAFFLQLGSVSGSSSCHA